MRMLYTEIITDYLEKINGYAVNHTYSRDEADELSREILLTVIRELPRLRDDSKFEPWLWEIANNVSKSFQRSMRKRRSTYFYDVLEDVPYESSGSEDVEETYDFLRTRIAMLSQIYRDIIILSIMIAFLLKHKMPPAKIGRHSAFIRYAIWSRIFPPSVRQKKETGFQWNIRITVDLKRIL